jgi:hypothetical protein
MARNKGDFQPHIQIMLAVFEISDALRGTIRAHHGFNGEPI